MKPFDLEAAKRGEPIVCRDGTPATFIAHVPEAREINRALVLRNGLVYSLFESGKYFESDYYESDLFMAPKMRTLWVNLYKEQGRCCYYDTEEEANMYGSGRIVKAFSLKILE